MSRPECSVARSVASAGPTKSSARSTPIARGDESDLHSARVTLTRALRELAVVVERVMNAGGVLYSRAPDDKQAKQPEAFRRIAVLIDPWSNWGTVGSGASVQA